MQKSWDDWAEHHAVLFGLRSDDDTAMLVEWSNLFRVAGWLPEQAWSATDWLALNNPPRYRSDHLALLVQRMKQQRQQHSAAPPDEDERFGHCMECRGCGRVSVPNPKAVAQGGWSTMAVACSCALGRWYQDSSGIMGLTAYQFAYPNWRQQLAQHEEWLKRSVRVTAFTKEVDKLLGAIKARLAQKEAGKR